MGLGRSFPLGTPALRRFAGSIRRSDYDRYLEILAKFLDRDDARRAAEVMGRLWAHGLRACALTGSLGLEAQIISNGRTPRRRRLNDLDFVVEEFDAIPSALADEFLVHHVHPEAPRGKLLLQLVDRDRALRIDLFRAFGATMSRARTLPGPLAPLRRVVSIEDLAARYTSHVYAHLLENHPVERKHAQAFLRLARFDTFKSIDRNDAWHDHRQGLNESFVEACRTAEHLLGLRPDLLFQQKYSGVVLPCDRCVNHGPFRRADPALIVDSLGYW